MGKYKFKFIDLFSGIGGFHYAMKSLGGECVFASEIDESCKQLYTANFPNTIIEGDIRKISPDLIPNFDVLCAGFPCQPFSKAGNQKGFQDQTRGNLFYVILSILDEHPETKFIFLENVRNLADKNENWDIIRNELMRRNFYITEEPVILSPTNFGIPQFRERVYIMGIRKDFRNPAILKNGFIHREDLNLEEYYHKCKTMDAWKLLEKNVSESYRLPDEQKLVLKAWGDFRKNTDHKDYGHTIWVHFFGIGIDDNDEYLHKIKFDIMPVWKQAIVMKNRKLYLRNKSYIDKWSHEYPIVFKNKLYQKFEWNCGNDVLDMKDAIIQIRQSGVRVKRPNFFPTLVAMSNIPIIWDQSLSDFRRVSPREAANMQSFPKKFKMIGTDAQLYKQLGNSVNIEVLKIIGIQLFRMGKWGKHD